MSPGNDEQTQAMAGHAERVAVTPKGGSGGIGAFIVLLLILLFMLAYGLYLGNVFETYHNGSNL